MRTTKRPTSGNTLLKAQQAEFDHCGRLNLKDGVSLYRHHKSPFIWADFRLPGGKRLRLSTRTDNLGLAITFARRHLKALQVAALNGEPISSRGPTVAAVLDPYLKSLEARLALGEVSTKPEISVVRRNLLPYWREIPLAAISRQTFYAWEDWRKDRTSKGLEVSTYERAGRAVTKTCASKPPSKTTIQREKNYFVKALDWATNQVQALVSDATANEIRHLPRRQKSTPKQRAVENRRDALSQEEVARLQDEFDRIEDQERDRVQRLGAAGGRKNYHRRLMGLHVRLLLLSGMRPGAEILEVTWDRLHYKEIDNGERIVVIDACGDGKTGPRIVNCDPAAVEVFADLKRLLQEFGFPTSGKAPLWPSLKGGIVKDMGKSFKSTLRRLGFRERVLDEPLYICRHTYMTERLRQRITSDVLAINCGTSAEMITKHYNHLRAETIVNALRPKDPSDKLRLESEPKRRKEGLATTPLSGGSALVGLAGAAAHQGEAKIQLAACSTRSNQPSLHFVRFDNGRKSRAVTLVGEVQGDTRHPAETAGVLASQPIQDRSR